MDLGIEAMIYWKFATWREKKRLARKVSQQSHTPSASVYALKHIPFVVPLAVFYEFMSRTTPAELVVLNSH